MAGRYGDYVEPKDFWSIAISGVALAASLWALCRVEWNQPRANWRLRIDWHTEERDLGLMAMVRFDAVLINIGSATATDLEVWPYVVSIAGQGAASGGTVQAGGHVPLKIHFPLAYVGGAGPEAYGPAWEAKDSSLTITYRDTPRGTKLRKQVLKIEDYMNRPPRL